MCEDKYIKDWEAFRPWANGSHISAKETKINEGHINRWLESCSPQATGKKGAGAETNRGKEPCLKSLTEQPSAKGTWSKPLLLTLRAVLTPLPSAGSPWRKRKGCKNKPSFRAKLIREPSDMQEPCHGFWKGARGVKWLCLPAQICPGLSRHCPQLLMQTV